MSDHQDIDSQNRLGVVLRHYRTYAGLSQEDLSRHSGVDPSNISLIESGKTARPQNHTLERLAAALAPYIPTANADRIYNHLLEAKDHRPEGYGVHPGLILINDWFQTRPPRLRALALDAMRQLLETLDKVFEAGRKG